MSKPLFDKDAYIRAVTHGEGWMPWQEREVPSAVEKEFRAKMEKRKDDILASRVSGHHPVMLIDEQIANAGRHIERSEWAHRWFQNIREVADHVVAQDAEYVKRMIPRLTPTNPYAFTCPACVGVRSQEGMGVSMFSWDYRQPEVIRCKVCGQAMPWAEFPETGVLECPRSGQTLTYYLNQEERRHPEDRSGQYAWKWVGKPANVSYVGIVRERQILFMIEAAKKLALAYRFIGNARYACRAIETLERMAECNRNWLYHDFYGAFADCDPLYAAWHYMRLPLEWKRHPSAMAYGDSRYETGPVNDKPDEAKMLATFFGCGRIHPSADTFLISPLCVAYDLVHDALGPDGKPLWTDASRAKVERDLFLEALLEGEPFLGGQGKADNLCNKAPYVYRPMADAAVCLGLPQYAHVALMGYEALRDRSFIYDGFSHESPTYTNMFLDGIVWVPQRLHGFAWPKGFSSRQGVVDVFGQDRQLRRILQTSLEQLRSNGRYLPLSDTNVAGAPNMHIFEIGLKHYPEIFAGTLPALYRGGEDYRDTDPTEFALFHLHPESIELDTGLKLPEILFPAWMTAVLRHGQGPDATDLALAFNPPGKHRHADNLSLYYSTRGRAVIGDLGYVGDSPFDSWYRSSHNLVVVDDTNLSTQYWRNDGDARRPALRWMVTSPRVSAVEAESRVYPQCSDYCRTVTLIKGPGTDTFAVDIFRVKGGRKHVYRLFSELAANDVKDSGLDFNGLDMPPDQSLPNFGASLRHEHVSGLIETRRVGNPPPCWQAVWREAGMQFRLHMFAPAAVVTESHGPGQERREPASQIGRRVRYLDVIREGENLASAFVVIHEPSGADGSLPILKAERLNVSPSAGTDAVALRIESKWGTYLVLSEFEQTTDIAGIRFQGALGIVCRKPEVDGWYFSVGSGTMSHENVGVVGESAWWEGKAVSHTENQIIAETKQPADWPPDVSGVQNYVIVEDGKYWTGFPVRETGESMIEVRHFPLQAVSRFRLPAVRSWEMPRRQPPPPGNHR